MSVPSLSAARPQSFHYTSPSRRSRVSYPTFLSIYESLQLQLTWAWRGLYDAFRWTIIFLIVAVDSEIRTNIYKSLLLNTLSLISIYTFDLLLLPLVQNKQKWFYRNIGWFYQVLWLLPVVGVSFYLNISWCSIIAKRTYTLRHGNRATAQQPTTYAGMLTAIATSAYRIIMVFTSVSISFALNNTPYIGSVAGFTFLCWINAYYCFEFVWMARGLSLSRRIRHLEERWAYYFAFGLPSAVLCTWGTGLANAAVFALVFPAYIILAMHAQPVPIDPYSPLPPLASSHPEETDIIRHPSPFVPIRLPIFTPVIWLNDFIVKIVSVGGGKSPRKALGRSRAFSDATENVEEGETIALNSLDGNQSRKPARPASNRVNIGRRKID